MKNSLIIDDEQPGPSGLHAQNQSTTESVNDIVYISDDDDDNDYAEMVRVEEEETPAYLETVETLSVTLVTTRYF